MYFTEVAEFMDEALKSGGKEAKSDLKMPYSGLKFGKKCNLVFFSVRPISFFSYRPIPIKPDKLNFLIGRYR